MSVSFNLFLTFSIFFLGCALSAPHEKLYYLVSGKDGTDQLVRVYSANPKSVYNVKEENVRAKVLYKQSYNQTGWDFLQISTSDEFNDEDQAYAAGFAEGVVTHDMIYMHWFNTLGDFCKDREDICEKIDAFVQENMKWVKGNIEKYANTVDYWHHVNLFYKQIEGLAAGYAYANKDDSTILTHHDLLWLNINGDLEDLPEALKAQERNFTQADFHTLAKVQGKERCSALIKILPDGSELFVAQDTWSSYQSMLRIQKKYDFAYHRTNASKENIPGSSMTFSSYPGVVTSGDDFYVISSGLVTLETTIGNSNSSLWKYIQPTNQISEGVRSMVANRLATSGRQWSKIFALYNSGTYNNQWMIVDYTKFKKGTLPYSLPENLLWVLEQIPNYIRAQDMTNVLRDQGYWPSYNTAFFKDIYNLSGNVPLAEKFGDWFTYEKNPRALIFKRDHGDVKDLKSMLSLMRYNNFKNDPLSACDCDPPYSAENAISARNDLNPANGTYPFAALGHRSHGATDAKITSHVLFLKGLQFLAISGPIRNDSAGIPPFRWSEMDFEKTTPHLGHPDLWNFEPLINEWV